MNPYIRGLWDAGLANREDFLDRGREAASLTLPHLAPDLFQGDKGNDLKRPFQSTGGDGVNNLAAKLSIGLFPPQTPYFRYELDADAILGALQGAQAAQLLPKVGTMKLSLSKRERSLQRQMDTNGARPRTFEALLNLIVNGNYLLRYDKDGVLRGFRLDKYMVKRNPDDRVLHIITREVVDRAALPDTVMNQASGTDLIGHDNQRMVDVYTIAERVPGKDTWDTWQEDREGLIVSPDGKEEGIADVDMPLMPLRMIPDSNEDYGRSWVEIRYSDLKGHEGLSQAILEAAAIAAHVVRVIDPAAGITPKELHTARNGGAIIGKGELINTIQLDKLADMSIAGSVNDTLRARLDQGFVRLSPRDAERVTAEEIRETVRELNEALGGVLSTFALEFQLPMVEKLERILDRKKLLPPLPFDGEFTSGIKVVTGIDAIGRGRDEIQLQSYLGTAQAAIGPENVALWLNVGEYLTRLAASQGIDPEGLIRTEQEVQAQQAQQQQAELANRVGPQAVKSIQELSQSGG